MALTSLNFPCANCGASLTVDGSTQTPKCKYCNTQNLLPQDIWFRFHPPQAAPQYPAPSSMMMPASPRGVNPWLFIGPILSIVIIAVVSIVVPILTRGPAMPSSDPAASQPTGPLDPHASVGDPCGGRTAACAKDKSAELQCGSDDKMSVRMTCKGPNGCQVSDDGNDISCDYTLASENDPCDVTDDACSTDHQAELRCQGGVFTVISTCKGPDGCTLTPTGKKGGGYTLSCDDHIADLHDPCFDSKRTACSSDGKFFLACTAQKFAVSRPCPRGCSVKKIAGKDSVEMDCQ
jgi:hypothetical protein